MNKNDVVKLKSERKYAIVSLKEQFGLSRAAVQPKHLKARARKKITQKLSDTVQKSSAAIKSHPKAAIGVTSAVVAGAMIAVFQKPLRAFIKQKREND